MTLAVGGAPPGRGRRYLVAFAGACTSILAFALDASASVLVDSVRVRFAAAELGGVAKPAFVMDRMLAFEAKLEMLAEHGDAAAKPHERHTRLALERHIAQSLLSAILTDREANSPDARAFATRFETALMERYGGEAVVRRIADGEGLSQAEVSAFFLRSRRAALAAQRVYGRFVPGTDAQLRELYGSKSHRYGAMPYVQARPILERWLVVERARLAEVAYYQAARSRLRLHLVR